MKLFGWPIALALCVVGCIDGVDLRSPELSRGGDPEEPGLVSPCPAGERIDPSSGECAACIVRQPHPFWVCPCGFEFHAAPFPYCEGEDADYTCDAHCEGLTACNAANPPNNDGSIRDCGELVACCDLIAQTPGATPCCELGEVMVCNPQSGSYWEYRGLCATPSCCDKTCVTNDDCLSFQACIGSRCLPGCNPDTEFCDDSGTSCVCQDWTVP